MFGLARVKDVNKIISKVNSIIDHENKQSVFIDNELSLLHQAVDSTAKTIHSLQAEVEVNAKQLIGLTKGMTDIQKILEVQNTNAQKTAVSVQRLANYVTQVSEQRASIMSKLQIHAITLITYLEGLISIARGTLSPYIVPPHDLENSLRKAWEVLQEQHPSYSIIHTDIAYYYDHHLSSFWYSQDRIIVHLQVPFSKEANSLYNIYQIHTVPIPLSPSDPSELGYTKISGIPEYIAVDQSMNSVIELTHKQIDLCTGESLLTCPFDHVMTRRPSYTCASAIFVPTRLQFQ